MIFGKNSFFIALLLLLTTPLRANDKTLLVDGIRAALYGDISADKGEWRNHETFSALRLKAGVQVVRIGFVGLTLGFQKVGFYTAEKNLSKEENRTRFDYRGPVEELHLFPDAMFSFSLAAHQGKGFSFLQAGGAADFGLCAEGAADCPNVKTERSKLNVEEYSAQVNYRFKSGLQFFLGAGQRQVKGTPEYAVFRSYDLKDPKKLGDFWESFDRPEWKVSNHFYLIGLRGTTL